MTPGFLLLVSAVLLSWLWQTPTPLTAYVLVVLALNAWRSRDGSHLRLYRLIRPAMVGQSLLALVAVAATIAGLLSLGNPILNFSWYAYLVSRSGGAPTGPSGVPGDVNGVPAAGNILMGPLDYPWLILPFLGLLLFLLPRLASAEERLFRQGTRSWRDASLRSLAFGVAHLPMGIPLGAALGLSLGGLWFTYQYFKGGVQRSALYHLTYNLLALSLIAIVLAGSLASG